MSSKELSEKPEKVVTAVKMLYLVIVIGVVRASITIISHIDVRSPFFLIFIKLIVYAMSAYLVYHLSKGKDWARWLLLVILTIAIPLSVLPTLDSFSHNTIHSLLGIIQLGLYIVALVFLFQRNSTDWFNKSKAGTDKSN